MLHVQKRTCIQNNKSGPKQANACTSLKDTDKKYTCMAWELVVTDCPFTFSCCIDFITFILSFLKHDGIHNSSSS